LLIMSLLKKILFGALAALFFIPERSSAEQTQGLEIEKVHLTSCVNNGPCTTGNKDVKLEDRVDLNAVVKAKVGGKNVYFSESNKLVIGGKKIDPSSIRKWGNGDISIKWYKIEPESNTYSNLWGNNFIWNTPSYHETLINSGNNFNVVADAHPSKSELDVNNGLGTMRYKLEVTHNKKKFSTSGINYVDVEGITKEVHRISFRKDDSFLGWITAAFNWPYIYGSAGKGKDHQSERYIGADCADLLTWASRKTGSNIPYSNARGLMENTKILIKDNDVENIDGVFYSKGVPISFGKNIQPGDLLFVPGHVVAIYEDKSDVNGIYKGKPNGILDESDLIIHTLANPPNIEPIFSIDRFNIGRLE